MFSSQSHLDKKDACLQNQYESLKFKCLGLGRFHRPGATKTHVPQLPSLCSRAWELWLFKQACPKIMFYSFIYLFKKYFLNICLTTFKIQKAFYIVLFLCIIFYLRTLNVISLLKDVLFCCCCCSVTMSSSLQPHGLQHTRLPCPSLSPWVCSNSCPLRHWRHLTISSSVSPFLNPEDFPGGSDGIASAYSAGDLGLISGSGRSSGEGSGNPLQYSCLKNSVDRGAW